MGEEKKNRTGEETSEDVVLCGANSYEEKYYFNEKFAALPQEVKDELKIMCVLYTEECGGILTLEFLRDGTLVFRTRVDDYDFYYDEIEAGLQIRKLEEQHAETLSKIELYYKAMYVS
ncbi:MAG: hypothetical protein IKI54_04140 [Lachnospiraceae bacterium]|nr:hypothetical protein [Lachnospiraceae bacterium]